MASSRNPSVFTHYAEPSDRKSAVRQQALEMAKYKTCERINWILKQVQYPNV
jgi:hypothetical protein